MNMQQIMAQAQKMQKELTNKKDEIDKKIFEGKSEWIKVEVFGNKKINKIEFLTDDVFQKDNSDILSDMMLLAVNDAMKKVDEETNRVMGAYSNLGGLL